MLSFDFEPPDPSHRLVSTLGVPELGFGSAFILCFLCCLLFNCIVTAKVLLRKSPAAETRNPKFEGRKKPEGRNPPICGFVRFRISFGIRFSDFGL